jgi:hypothetical protein
MIVGVSGGEDLLGWVRGENRSEKIEAMGVIPCHYVVGDRGGGYTSRWIVLHTLYIKTQSVLEFHHP